MKTSLQWRRCQAQVGSEFPYWNQELSEFMCIGCWAPWGLFPLLSPRMRKARPSSSRKDTGRTRLRRNTRHWILLSQTAQPGDTTASRADSSLHNNSYPTTLLHLHCYKKPTQLDYFNHIIGFCLCSCFPTIISAVVRANFKNIK